MPATGKNEWNGTTYGNSRWVNRLIAMLRVVDVRVFYWIVLIFAIPPTLLLSNRSRRIIYRYYRTRHSMGTLRSFIMTWRTYNTYATVILDRFAMYAGQHYDMDIDGYEHYERLASRPGAFIQLSSHIGNYEIAGYSLKALHKRFNALVFGGEKDFVMSNRDRLFGHNNIRMIAVDGSMSHIFEIDSAINAGEIVSMPADRLLGSTKAYDMMFMGASAKFPQGPFVTAALKGVPMLYVAVMKRSTKRYRVIVRPICADCNEECKPCERARKLAEIYRDYLQQTVMRYPEQWFNFYEFWDDDSDSHKLA